MIGKIFEMNTPSKVILGMAAGLFFVGAQAARGQVLFTTQDDFSGWSSNGNGNIVVGTQASPDYDGSTTNGLGNTTTGPGNTGVAGSMVATFAPAAGSYTYFYSQGEQGNTGFLDALGSGGTVSFEYQEPTNNGGTYFELGLVLNYTGNFFQNFGTSVSDGGGWYTASIPYSVNVQSSYTYFQMGLIWNSNYNTSAPTSVTVDDIAVPEPASVGTLAAGLTLLTFRRRRKA